jgi:glucose-1-phosphate adenylyltransferase
VVRRSLLFNNVRVNSYAEIEESVILPDVEIGRSCRIRRAVVERWTRIPPETVIGEDRAEDTERFHVTEDGIVVVTPDMLEQVHPQRSQRRPALTMMRMGIDGPDR